MDLPQIYETTIYDEAGRLGFTVLTIPARSYSNIGRSVSDLEDAARELFGVWVEPVVADPEMFYFGGPEDDGPADDGAEGGPDGPESEYRPSIVSQMLHPLFPDERDVDLIAFTSYLAEAPVIPFEQSPLAAESLANIALKSTKAGAVGIGATVGYISAGPTPFLLVTVPLGIILCGAAISFAKWLEENRKPIWNRLLQNQNPKRPRRRRPQSG